jgi:glycosyltransferase involved in cell wall biosynthesis
MRPAAPLPIGVFLSSFWPGGTERQMLELVRRLDPRQFTVHVACFRREGNLLPLAERHAASVTEFRIPSLRSRAMLRAASDFRAWCRERRLAVLHTSDLYANVFGLPNAAAARVPVRIGNRRELNPDKSLGQLVAQRVAYAFAHRVATNSSAGAARLRREGIPRDRIVQVPNGIDLDAFFPAPNPGPPRRIVTVARLRPEKGHDLLIEAVAVVFREFPDATLTIVGDGPLREELARRVAERGLAGQVQLAGHTDDVAGVLRQHDLFVLATRSEAFPNSVIEAMASGLAVLTTRVGGIPELVEDGRNGLLVRPDRPEELRAGLVRLLGDTDLARALGAAARADVVSRFSFDRMVGQFTNLYLAEFAGRASFHAAPSGSRAITS